MLISEMILAKIFGGYRPVFAETGFFAEHEILGYVLAGVLAFVLGILVTVFCFRMRKHMEDKENDRKH